MRRRTDRQVLVMALALLGFTSIAVIDRAAAPFQDAFGRTMAPAQRVLNGASYRLSTIADGVKEANDLRDQVSDLRSQNDLLQVENLKVNDLARENDDLRQLLGFAHERVDLDLRGASIIGRKIAEEPGNLSHTIKLDIGSRHGIEMGMPVANDRGLIGRVQRVGTTWSDVLLLIDPASAVQARIERTRDTGVVFGTTTGELRLRFIPQDIEGEPNVDVGDVVFTSGLSREFPPMLPIGQVVAVEQSDVETHQEALIHPTVDFTTLEIVLVVRGQRSSRESGGP